MISYDYIILGAGLYGSFCAYVLTQKGYSVLVIDCDASIEEFQGLWGYQSKNDYNWSRYRKIGGRSLHWGGNICLPTSADKKFLFKTSIDQSRNLDKVLEVSSNELDLSSQYRKRTQTNIKAFKLRKNADLMTRKYIHRLLFELERAVAVEVYDIDKQELQTIRGANFILCCSPFENSNLLSNSELPTPLEQLGQHFNDHFVCSYLVVTEGIDNIHHEVRFENEILYEVSGPFDLASLTLEELNQMGLSSHEGRYQYYMLHGFIKSDNQHNRYVLQGSPNKIGFTRPEIDWSYSKKDLERITFLENKMGSELEKLFGKNIIEVFQTSDPRVSQSIPHETGGVVMGECCDHSLKIYGTQNVFIGDASFLGDALSVYPTYSVMWKLMEVYT